MRCLLVVACACSYADSAPQARDRATPRSEDVAHARAPALVGDARVSGNVIAAQVVASVDGAPASDRPAYARADQKVELYAVIELSDHRRFSDAPKLVLGGRSANAAPLADGPAIAIAWQRIEPAAASISNTDDTGFHFTPIEYRATELDDTQAGSLAADVRPTLTPDHGHGVGTMRYQIVVAQGDHVIASPGVDARRGRGSGGLTDAVMRVSIRRDDTYLGYLTEMFGQPYIWASAGLTDATHQSERLEGADCADFVVYGQRRMGKKLAYTWTGGLPQVTKLLASGARDDHGIYRDAHGAPIPFTRAGDVILFPRHVGVLVEDRGEPGILDDQDIMMHALLDTPKQQAIADSGYADTAIELRRF